MHLESRQRVVVLDVEGVLTHEVWLAIAAHTEIEGLRLTTRDEPDYDKLMRHRLELLELHGVTMTEICGVLAGVGALSGAPEFLAELRSRHQVVLLSDTFEQFAGPLLSDFGQPTVLCHRLVVEGDRIVDFRPRIDDQKRRAVEAFQSLNYEVIAAGDSYNDLSMLLAADRGCLFRAPDSIKDEQPGLHRCDAYHDLLSWIDTATS